MTINILTFFFKKDSNAVDISAVYTGKYKRLTNTNILTSFISIVIKILFV